jgi:hypothetical protein
MRPRNGGSRIWLACAASRACRLSRSLRGPGGLRGRVPWCVCRWRCQLGPMWFACQSWSLSGDVQGLLLGRYDPVDHPQDPRACRPDLRDVASPGECRGGGPDQHQHGERPRSAQRAGRLAWASRGQAIHRGLCGHGRRLLGLGVGGFGRGRGCRVPHRNPLRIALGAANLPIRLEARRWHLVFGGAARASDSHGNPLWDARTRVVTRAARAKRFRSLIAQKAYSPQAI